MHQHGMNGMAGHCHGGAYIPLRHGPNARIGVRGVGLARRFFGLDFGFLGVFGVSVGQAGPLALRFAALAATPLALTGCATPLSALNPAGPAAANIATLWWVMFWGATALFILVLALLALSFIRPAFIAAIKPAHWIIGGGLLMPIPILVGLLIAALLLGEQLLPKPGGTTLRVEAHASQWQWRFSYPDNPGTAASEVLHLPAGEPVDIVVTAEDVIHAFWVPRLGGKIDAIPGHTNVIRLQADEPGIYRGICAEYCGQGHETMGFVVEAHAPDDYAAVIGGST
jgi:cytochrome c oxidase subunit II